MYLKDASEDRDNNFNLIRFLAAVSVIITHAWPLSMGPDAIEPMAEVLGIRIGRVGVLVFFVISGFLITRSFERTGQISHWIAARALRIFPALIAVLLVTVFLIGPLMTDLPLGVYFSAPETLSYFPRNLLLFSIQYNLPGVFETVPYPNIVNGPLWTLFYEVVCYAGVLLAGVLGAFASRSRLWLVIFAYLVFYVSVRVFQSSGLIPNMLVELQELSLPFGFGALFYLWRSRIPLNWWIAFALAGVAALARQTPLYIEFLCLAISYWVFAFAFLVRGAVRLYNRIGDYSYGLYIYGFIAQQSVAQWYGVHDPLTNILISTPLALIFAILSWHLVESRALALKPGRPAATTSTA